MDRLLGAKNPSTRTIRISMGCPTPNALSSNMRIGSHCARVAGELQGARPVARSRFDRAVLGCAACLLATAFGSGCHTLSKQGPLSQSVASGRQLTQQGMTAMEREDWKRAESLLARAVHTSPTDPDARRNYAEALWHRGAKQAALEQFERARELDGENPALAVRTGELYLALGQVNYAQRMVDEALKLDPKLAAAWALRGKVSSAIGQPRQALADYQRALGYAPDNHEVTLLLAETYRQVNEPERALVALQAVADSYSPGEEPQKVLYLEGLALTAMGRYDEASKMLAQAAHRERPTADILCHLAEAEMLTGRQANAQYTLEQALAIDPDHAPSRTLASRMALATQTAGQPVRR